jgi:hypothetical protein
MSTKIWIALIDLSLRRSACCLFREEDEDQFIYHGKLIKMGFIHIALSSVCRASNKKAKDEDQIIHHEKPIKNGVHSHCASSGLPDVR